MERSDYKYAVLNGNQAAACVGGTQRKRCRFYIGAIVLLGLLLALAFIYSTKSIAPSKNMKRRPEKVLLISIDALRYNLRDKAPTPNLDFLAKNGVSVGYMMNVFPTVTMTNHQSIVTGLYAKNHGIVGNKMYDRKTKEVFNALKETTKAEFWNDAIPIWTENELQGHESGVCFWPGYDVLFRGKQATHLPSSKYVNPLFETEKGFMPYEKRVDLATEWLKKPAVNFVALYFGRLDMVMHKLSPDPKDEVKRKELQTEITKIDTYVGQVLSNLKKDGQTTVNIIVVGDHGQSNMNRETNVIDLTRYVNLTKRAFFHGDGHIYAKPGQKQIIYDKLKQAEKKEGHFKVYLRKEIPKRYHLREHPRTGDILMIPDDGMSLWTYGDIKRYRSKLSAGAHGYSTDAMNMRPAFFGYGPSFKQNYKQEVVNMVDLYELMCRILQITPRRNDGSFQNVQPMLQT